MPSSEEIEKNLGLSGSELFKYKKAAEERRYKAIESFSGPGGMSLGLELAGFEVLVAFDNNAKAVETHSANLGGRCFQADAASVTGAELREKSQLNSAELDLFAGGPPCQGFSKQKRGAHLGDTRNNLILEYIRLVGELSPRFFLFENVAIFGQKRGKQYLREIEERLDNYTLTSHFYNSADYGLAQTRERFILVGRRSDVSCAFRIPFPTVSKWLTVGEVLKGLPEPPEDYSVHLQYPNHQRAKVTPINVERFSHVPEGGGWQDIPNHLRLKCHRNVDPSSGGWPDVYGRLEWSGQCPTITGGFDSFTRGRYGHPRADRPLTPREAARLQGFPDDFVFLGNRGDVRSQIGNVVPPPLAKAVGMEIFRSLLVADGVIRPMALDRRCHTQSQRQLALL